MKQKSMEHGQMEKKRFTEKTKEIGQLLNNRNTTESDYGRPGRKKKPNRKRARGSTQGRSKKKKTVRKFTHERKGAKLTLRIDS